MTREDKIVIAFLTGMGAITDATDVISPEMAEDVWGRTRESRYSELSLNEALVEAFLNGCKYSQSGSAQNIEMELYEELTSREGKLEILSLVSAAIEARS